MLRILRRRSQPVAQWSWVLIGWLSADGSGTAPSDDTCDVITEQTDGDLGGSLGDDEVGFPPGRAAERLVRRLYRREVLPDHPVRVASALYGSVLGISTVRPPEIARECYRISGRSNASQ